MKTLLIGLVIGGLVALGGVFLGYKEYHPATSQTFGNVTPVQGSQFTLAGAGVTSSATTITLSSFDLPDPNSTPITMSMFGSIGYGVIEPQTSKIENISFTGVTQNSNGTATLTGVSRGLSFYSPYAASTTLELSHAGGSYFILSNPGAFYSQFAFLNNPNTFSQVNTYGSTTPPTYDADPVWANFSTQVFADVSYVNSVVAGGAANASETVKGIVQLATAAQAALGTSLGSTGARLGIPNSLATSTPYNSGTNAVPVTGTNEKLSQLFLDLTQAFNVSGLWNFSATTTMATTTMASSTITTANIGTLNVLTGITVIPTATVSGLPGKFYLNTAPGTIGTNNSASTTIFSVSVPGGTLNTANILTFTIPATFLQDVAGGGTSPFWIDVGYGTASTTIALPAIGTPVSGGSTETIYLVGGGSTGSQLLTQTFVASSTMIAGSASLSQDSTTAKVLTMVARFKAADTLTTYTPYLVTGVLSK